MEEMLMKCIVIWLSAVYTIILGFFLQQDRDLADIYL